MSAVAEHESSRVPGCGWRLRTPPRRRGQGGTRKRQPASASSSASRSRPGWAVFSVMSKMATDSPVRSAYCRAAASWSAVSSCRSDDHCPACLHVFGLGLELTLRTPALRAGQGRDAQGQPASASIPISCCCGSRSGSSRPAARSTAPA